jgi:hypothetical protein
VLVGYAAYFGTYDVNPTPPPDAAHGAEVRTLDLLLMSPTGMHHWLELKRGPGARRHSY